MNFEILEGDVLNVLPMLPDNYFQTCVTSPPYWGLRDYGTGSWHGGDPQCDHKKKRPETVAKGNISTGLDTSTHSHIHEGWIGGVCGRCGAVKKDQQLGLEPTFEEYLETQTRLFRDIRRVLKPDGTLWMNMGDSYCANMGKGFMGQRGTLGSRNPVKHPFKQKDLLGQPWALAFALRNDGWYLRSDIIWAKPNPMPESTKDRPTKAHEYIFLLSKSPTYFYDIDAIREPLADVSLQRIAQPSFDSQTGGPKDPRNGGEGSPNRSARKVIENFRNSNRYVSQGKSPDNSKKRMPAGWATSGSHNVVDWATNGRQGRGSKPSSEYPAADLRDGNRRRLDKEGPNSRMHFDRDPAHRPGQKKRNELKPEGHQRLGKHREEFRAITGKHDGYFGNMRNKRTVWNIATQAFPEAHFATFPEELARTCILAGSKIGDMVLDPYSGSGTTGLVACGLGRGYVGIEVNPEYADMSRRRIGGPLFASVQ